VGHALTRFEVHEAGDSALDLGNFAEAIRGWYPFEQLSTIAVDRERVRLPSRQPLARLRVGAGHQRDDRLDVVQRGPPKRHPRTARLT
jgi:hypothetical protein